MDRVSSLAKAKQHRLHLQHSAPGSGSPLALRQGSCTSSQPLLTTLCFHFTVKRSQNVKAVPQQQQHICSTKLRVSHTKARCEGKSGLHKGPQPFQTIHNCLENKSRKWQSRFVHAASGQQTQACSLCDCTWKPSHPGLSVAKADLGTPPVRQHGQGRGCTPLLALSCTDTARLEQGHGCTKRQGTPTAALDHEHKNALHPQANSY